MVMRPEPIAQCVEDIKAAATDVETVRTVLLSPRGRRLDHGKVRELAALPQLILICGRYEGIDERVAEEVADEELSLGDFVLSGGELAAMVVIEATSRFIPGVLGNEESLLAESHTDDLLEYPQYTRPPEWRGRAVPEVLLSGDHGAVDRWRRNQSERITRERREG
jgi:tRNA (guanine37-N1)-methyltransferase